MRRANVNTGPYEYLDTDPEGYLSGSAAVGKTAGGDELNVFAYEIPPGQSVCPYHYEYVEEWLLVLGGEVVLRAPDGEHRLAAGDLVRFARGPEGAHKAANRGTATARVLMFSSGREPSVAVYPDSDKIGVSSGNVDDRVLLKRADGHVDYYDGER